MKGWVKLHRKILENGLFFDAELFKVFVWCLLKANFKNKPIEVYNTTLKTGQFLTGQFSASEELNIKPSTVYNRLQRLKRMGYISIRSTNKYSIITVKNYKKYQAEETPSKAIEERFNEFHNEVITYSNGCEESVLEAFISYWTEKNKSKTKMRFELQKTWDTKRRLANWNKNNSKFNKPKESKVQQQISNWQEARNIINNG
tara:strand:+ start:1988 stop:2593 length:606 start_codon:yes stop_codon:yes gene_type:complete